MKKTVQIVTMPLNKEGWSHGDLLYDNTCKEYAIAIQSCIDVDWQAQQLLVLSDDEVKEEDWYTLIIADKGVVGRKLFKCYERPINRRTKTIV